MSLPSRHRPETTDRRVVVLKSPRFGARGSRGPLPYRMDLLRDHGIDLVWTDRHGSGRWARIARRTEGRTVPWVQALLTRSDRKGAAATLAMFESEGHGLALFRSLTGRRRPPLVVIACWLADLAQEGGWRTSLYRWIYRSVDAVVVFSSNQRTTLVERLGIDESRIVVVPFGIDLDELRDVPVHDAATVVAIGRDLGRDWPTFAKAVAGTGWPVALVTRPAQVEGIDLPPEVEFRGTVDRAGYLALLAGARVVAVPTHVREYPTGQTVLLEAMALGKACVVTDTPAMREYVDDGVTAVLVPPGDAGALQVAIRDLMDDAERRDRIGAAAKAASAASGGAASMWARVADAIVTVR